MENHAPVMDDGRSDPASYRAVVEHIPAILYTEVDAPDGSEPARTVFLGPQVEAMLGFPAAELTGDRAAWDRITHPDDLETIREADRRSDETGEPFFAEYRIFDRDGGIHWFRDRASLRVDPATGARSWQGMMIEITEEKRALEQLREAETRYRSLVETLPAVVFIDLFDDEATNVYTSPQTEAILGYTVEDWSRDPNLWQKIVHPEDRERVDVANRTHTEHSIFDEEYRMIAKDGRLVWVRDVGVAIEGADGRLYSHGFLLDVTAQKVAESALREALAREHDIAERLREVDGLRQTLLHTLSHDLKAPLAAILGAAATLADPSIRMDDEVRRDLFDGIGTRARRMDQLLTDILDLERLDQGLVEPNRAPTDLGELLRRVLAHSDPMAGRAVEIDADGVVADVDASKVERIAENLLVNAARHTAAGTPILARAHATPAGVELVVEDRGPGVPDGSKAAIFEAFHRGDGDAARGPAGAGIGLSLVARFAALHGGRAWVEDRPGGGASFHVVLP